MWKNLWDLFVAFFRSSFLSYGGGPAGIPLVRKEVVETFQWFTNEEFADALAIGNALPGPIAPKLAAYVGNSVAGIPGAVIAISATVIPFCVAVIVIANFLLAQRDSLRVQGMLQIAKPMVVSFLLYTAYTMMTRSTYPNVSAYIVSAVALALTVFVKINPAFVVIGGLILGFAMPGWFLG